MFVEPIQAIGPFEIVKHRPFNPNNLRFAGLYKNQLTNEEPSW